MSDVNQGVCTFMKNIQIISFILLILLSACSICTSAEETKIHVLDVGTGDAILVESEGINTLIDAGPDRNTTAAYLTDHNITDIHLFLVTSMEPGKIGGVLEVMNRTNVHEYRDTGTGQMYFNYKRILEKIQNESITYHSLKPGERIPIGTDTTIDVINIAQTHNGIGDEAILNLHAGNVSMLLLSENGSPDIDTGMKIQILRVPDHGSRQAFDMGFVHMIKPEVAVISIGREGNGPNKATEMGLEAAGAEVYRTDIRGTILIATDGENYTIGSSRTSPAGSISLMSVIETQPPA